MPLRLASPEWLLLVPVVALLAWRWPGLRLATPWRGLAVLLIILALARFQWSFTSPGLDLWVLVDRSASAAEPIAQHLPEWQDLLERSRGGQDRIRYVDYAAEVLERSGQEGERFAGNPSATDLPLALRYALSRRAPDRAARLLVLTDGYSTRALGDLGERFAREGVALDYRLARPETSRDVRIESFQLPERAKPGEPFLLEATFSGSAEGPVPYRILRDGQRIHEGQAELSEGQARLRFADRLRTPGAAQYEIQITPALDGIAGNNTASTWIEIAGGERILVVSSYTDDPLAAALRQQGFDAALVTDPASLHLGSLSGTRALVLNNIPAHVLPAPFLKAVDFYVRSQGRGLLMAGGKNSFGSGGYFQSPIDSLLPVSMELRSEHRKLAVAMAIVMDRSGSMGAVAPGGSLMKMDLANEGAARAVELLSPQDAVTVFAVDSQPHTIVPLTLVGSDPHRLTSTIRRVAPGGGGIFVYTGLEAAWKELRKSDAGQRHMILFADAADAEEPGAYKKLLAEMAREGATVSVIGLGSPSDADAKLLEDVADRGKGRIFFNSNPSDLPTLFAQETVSVARSLFLEEKTPLRPTAEWLELAARNIAWPATVDGYNLSYLRPEASAAALSGDEYAAPLIAFWQRGAGRSAAVSFPLAGSFAASTLAWPQYGDFVQTLVRWLTGSALPQGLGLKTSREGSELVLDFLYTPEHEDLLASSPPRIQFTDNPEAAPSEGVWQRLTPGHYQARLPLSSGRPLRGAVQVGPHSLAFGPITAVVDPEWDLNPARPRELAATSARSGGSERLDLTTIWDAPRAAQFTDLALPLLTLALLAHLLDCLWSRLGLPFHFPNTLRLARKARASSPP